VVGGSLRGAGYLANERISSVVYLGDRLGKPVLVEGPAGTGKTELAKSVARMSGMRLIRLQCYEGLDEAKALYEWNYKKQLLRIQAERTGSQGEMAEWTELEADIFSEEFLLARPLLSAIRAPDPVVLLIDEVDRLDVETEALLLEVLSDYQVSIPELGTVTSAQTPLVFLAELLLPLTEEWDRDLASADPLGFPGYAEALAAAQGESIRTGLVASRGVRAVLIQSDFEIFGGTMGAVAGEKIVRSFRRAVDQRLPVVAVTRTGGARMQEGMASLIRMPRTVTAVDEHARSGLLSAIVYRSPTTGGVFASWASLLDVRAAEPHATMGFAGPRVVRQVTGEDLPAWSYSAENAHVAGLVDALVDRAEQAAWVNAVLAVTACRC